MIAFFDAEYNCNSRLISERTDMSLIDIALIIVEDASSPNNKYTYRSFVKPGKNNGIIYPRIAELTGIKQASLDCGHSFQLIMKSVLKIIEEYDITCIYTWGDKDKSMLRWNMRTYGPIIGVRKKFVNKIYDISPKITKALKIPVDTSLTDIAYICGCRRKNSHNAWTDALVLRNVVRLVKEGNYSKEKIEAYKEYYKQKKAYCSFRSSVNKLAQANLKYEDMLKLALEDKDFPRFGE